MTQRNARVKMDSELEKAHLQSLEEYVLDEEKIVTYRWLSKVLSIHVNLSKELLQKFSSDPSHKNNVYLTYLLSGKVKDGSYQVLVVGQDKYEDTKSDFDVITSLHVYSVQKNKETLSANLLYMANSEKVENDIDVSKQIGVIKCPLSIQRAEDEMSNLRIGSLLKNAPRENIVSAKKGTKPVDNVKPEVEKKDEKEAKTETPEQKPKVGSGGIAAMFAAQSSKSASVTSSSSKTKAKPPPKKCGGINSFFSKVPKTESPPKGDEQPKSNGKQLADEPMDVDDSAEKTDTEKSGVQDIKREDKSVAKDVEHNADKASSPKTVNPMDEEASKSSSKTPKNKPKRKSKPKSSAKPAKTRKRIKVVDSDSSDDMFGSEKEDEPVDRNTPTPPPSRKIIDSDDEIIPPTPQPLNDSKNRRKRKVVKDKSYMDDDGFIVTEKVTVYESCTDSDSENKPNEKHPKEDKTNKSEEEIVKNSPKRILEEKPTSKSIKTKVSPSKTNKSEKTKINSKNTKISAKKPVSPGKNKQASLMSFFKKV